MIDSYGKDYVLNAQGIFYHDSYSQALVTGNRKVWVPSLEDVDWEADSEIGRRGRAQTVAKHSKENERRHKSEYAWEADAWSDVFGTMRNDVYVEADKHDYIRNKPNTDPVKYTFGLATFTERNPISMPGAASFGSTVQEDLVFPFAVYEAKGWSGDYREARRQLSRKPGPVDSIQPYQKSANYQYQVFALTSFAAYWHLLVGYRRTRMQGPEEHGSTKGVSDM
ncbi:hypothetical protein K432DRAFT_437750 [Lepidopterella palustris CBS 459.81]|uniref:Uncharacterized protein n=1 Tax=Lepidopterella palustris CBS 459.81 TaxID=1314670 RepID=A0A8E2E058_9PEZI|nr:hypothetical protein K432DRAFT_437750 [Lepidopterella palustris CBS 459.81]